MAKTSPQSSMEYSTSSSRGRTSVSGDSGWALGSTHDALDVLLDESTTIHAPDRVDETEIKKRSSGSSNTRTSDDCAVPNLWRHTRHGRIASSGVT